MKRIIPLVSDTETKPTVEMRKAIASAEVGDEQRGEDPTVNRLQARVAELLGKEAALWFPGGTMCNFVATKIHTRPADAIVADGMAHIIRAESAGVAFSSGVLVEPIETKRGIFTAHQLEQAYSRLLTAPNPYGPVPRLVCVEQTHNFGGGSIWSIEELRAIRKEASRLNMSMHMDGARLMNAVVATGESAQSFGEQVDSLWIDFTKGLGAPIGAVLAGTRDFIAEARRYKHIFGGAMRQAGIAAAGCLYALDHHIERLKEDHYRAQHLAASLSNIPGLTVRNAHPESNMVFFDASGLGLKNSDFLSRLLAEGVRMGQVRGQIRAVTHLDVTDSDIETTVEAIKRIASSSTFV